MGLPQHSGMLCFQSLLYYWVYVEARDVDSWFSWSTKVFQNKLRDQSETRIQSFIFVLMNFSETVLWEDNPRQVLGIYIHGYYGLQISIPWSSKAQLIDVFYQLYTALKNGSF